MVTIRNAAVWLLAFWLSGMAPAFAKERIYRGKWDGTAVEIRLSINARTGTVTGQVYGAGDPSNTLATLSGRVLPGDAMELNLTYRFEDYGTYLLQATDNGETRIWRTERKDLWFGLSD